MIGADDPTGGCRLCPPSSQPQGFPEEPNGRWPSVTSALLCFGPLLLCGLGSRWMVWSSRAEALQGWPVSFSWDHIKLPTHGHTHTHTHYPLWQPLPPRHAWNIWDPQRVNVNKSHSVSVLHIYLASPSPPPLIHTHTNTLAHIHTPSSTSSSSPGCILKPDKTLIPSQLQRRSLLISLAFSLFFFFRPPFLPFSSFFFSLSSLLPPWPPDKRCRP